MIKLFKQPFIGMLIIVLFNSCETLDQFTKFNIVMSENITIAPTLAINLPFDIPTPPIKLNTTSTFESNNTHKDLVQEIALSELQMTIIAPTDEDFSILKKIEIYILADGLAEQKIAFLDSIPNAATMINLNVLNISIKDYILKDSFELKVKTVTDEVNTQEYKIKIDAKFNVNAKILGV